MTKINTTTLVVNYELKEIARQRMDYFANSFAVKWVVDIDMFISRVKLA